MAISSGGKGMYKYDLPLADRQWFHTATNLHGGNISASQGSRWNKTEDDDLVAYLDAYAATPESPIYLILRRAFPGATDSDSGTIDAALGSDSLSADDRGFLLAMKESQLCVTRKDGPGSLDEDTTLSVEERKRRKETFAMVANVQRQAAFVDKMHQHLWLRSPGFQGTLRRAMKRYENFVQLFKEYPRQVLVPTLDIDLCWHTHQCSASLYKVAMLERAGRFINHDDKYGKNSLDEGMEKTAGYFLERFGEQYQRCLCWECEATMSVIEDADERGELLGMNDSELARRVFHRVLYYREAEILRRKGGMLPSADQEPM
jgi:hypothetical protein